MFSQEFSKNLMKIFLQWLLQKSQYFDVSYISSRKKFQKYVEKVRKNCASKV